ncbi:hypothetical protein LPH50_05165 [Xylella taiwanensis]|uniref:Uncharacterized protein n=1 Tax=Xylella taiwanensis TaxID=1444770 RepID=A0ABS8TU50_9GAMM|nr:hypothetical protein [Xylella taiwanensis]MCD8455367.1 hypothetical protein [Xylella taiwanensis]MCD8457771.1 hypothetical protein [Xylella taiwanensis]MCD8459906.1 hypothetical protein [Xylella taiwanensis]MCD8464032.1 hypothetical protein [Xylella taiwanensis]MCD8464411.1 hypothetical protein [Xylella taiwanensis]
MHRAKQAAPEAYQSCSAVLGNATGLPTAKIGHRDRMNVQETHPPGSSDPCNGQHHR